MSLKKSLHLRHQSAGAPFGKICLFFGVSWQPQDEQAEGTYLGAEPSRASCGLASKQTLQYFAKPPPMSCKKSGEPHPAQSGELWSSHSERSSFQWCSFLWLSESMACLLEKSEVSSDLVSAEWMSSKSVEWSASIGKEDRSPVEPATAEFP